MDLQAKDATAQAIADVLKKKGLKNVTADDVAAAIDEAKSNGEDTVKEQAASAQTATAAGCNVVQSPVQK
ncbi:hypothetical protein [Sporolactobacillus terrae]|uniref:hypothetical protein n=1 Tax=Sporolactobacillus terrae TaxID=269673 RepID=UPI00048DD5A8|nr:hypothetical protein [Sporolactobacillus terrae]UAK18089.1 hypothetical protein K7399_02310 [Sporolactobacillus terrae]